MPVRTREPYDSIAGVGGTAGPVIDAIRNALSIDNISLEGAQHVPSPMAFPPWYIVIARTSANIAVHNLKYSLDELWPQTTDIGGNLVPPADIQVEEYQE
ncbi:hypothetical protein N7465_003497 [Penicillium sp. CMV-2018d]|nr:hypothetical protein N7465_003497 [Penicillium sp. CMV-2018d]